MAARVLGGFQVGDKLNIVKLEGTDTDRAQWGQTDQNFWVLLRMARQPYVKVTKN
jgi:hypothetical protein